MKYIGMWLALVAAIGVGVVYGVFLVSLTNTILGLIP